MKRDHEYTHFIAVLMAVAGLAAPRTMQAQSMSQPAGIMTQDDSVRMVSRYGKTVNGYRSDEKTYWLKTNGVALGMLITNVAFEAELLPRFTVSLPVYFSTLNYFSSKWKFRGFALQPELRYYPKLYAGNQQVGGATTENITINGNDNTLVFGGKGNDSNMLNGNITIKDATVNYDNIGGTNTWNARSISFGGNLVAENVAFNNEVAAKGLKAEFKNCIFNEATDNYTLWLSATLENVVIDGCTFTAKIGRGIKIADQYVDTPKQVNLTISNSTFTTANKAAVLVTNTAGAKIKAQTNNISGVAADTENLVWNDPDRATAYDDVEVYGCTKKQEEE